eukprot:1934956-Prymnesium_polylepis.1
MERAELLDMMSAIYPQLSSSEAQELLAAKGWGADFEAGITKDELQEAILEWNAVLISVEESQEEERNAVGHMSLVHHSPVPCAEGEATPGRTWSRQDSLSWVGVRMPRKAPKKE